MKRKLTMINWRTISFSLIAFTLVGCVSSVKMDHRWKRQFNLCKELKGDVLIYPIFVQEKKGVRWEKEEINAYMDSIKIATTWLSSQAAKSDIKLNFINQPHPKVSTSGLPGKSIDGTYSMTETLLGIGKINKHYDNITKREFRAITKSKKAKAPYISRPKTKDHFISKLRNNFQVESVVLLFVHKPEKKNNIIFSANTLSSKEIEYSVTSFKTPSLISVQILELFGGAVFHYDVKKKKQAKIQEHIEANFPNDLMAKPMQNINKTEIGEVTQYLVGWKSELDPKHEILMEGGKVKVKK